MESHLYEFSTILFLQVLSIRLIHLLARNDRYIFAVDLLNQCECNLNTCTVDQHLSPIDIAVRENQTQWVKFLVENDCEINTKSKSNSEAPIEIAIEKGYEDIIDILLTRTDIELKFEKDPVDLNNLLLNCIERCPRSVERLLKLGACPDFYNKNGLTPLMLSVTNSDSSMIKLLLSYGANPNFIPTCVQSSRLFPYGCPLLQAIQEGDFLKFNIMNKLENKKA